MPSLDPSREGERLPAGVRNFLTVTHPDGAPRTGAVAPSPLLRRVEAFLPALAAANARLPSRPGSAVRVERVAPGAAAEPRGDGVHMDLYVDDTLGQLVPSEAPPRPEAPAAGDPPRVKGGTEGRPRPPLIQVVGECQGGLEEDSAEGGTDDQESRSGQGDDDGVCDHGRNVDRTGTGGDGQVTDNENGEDDARRDRDQAARTAP